MASIGVLVIQLAWPNAIDIEPSKMVFVVLAVVERNLSIAMT